MNTSTSVHDQIIAEIENITGDQLSADLLKKNRFQRLMNFPLVLYNRIMYPEVIKENKKKYLKATDTLIIGAAKSLAKNYSLEELLKSQQIVAKNSSQMQLFAIEMAIALKDRG